MSVQTGRMFGGPAFFAPQYPSQPGRRVGVGFGYPRAMGSGSQTAGSYTNFDAGAGYVASDGYGSHDAQEVVAQVYARRSGSVPSHVMEAALRGEMNNRIHNIKFEAVMTDGPAMSEQCSLGNTLAQNTTVYQTSKPRNVHLVFKRMDSKEFYLRALAIMNPGPTYKQGGVGGVARGMVFVTRKPPNLEKLAWCDNFTLENYTKFCQTKKASGKPWKDNEPLEFFTMSSTRTPIKVANPRRGRYVVIKLLCGHQPHGIALQQVQFNAMHGTHPLGAFTNDADWNREATKLRQELKVASDFDEAEGWTLARDEDITRYAQRLSSELGFSPMTLDSVMIQPSQDDLIDFANLDGASLRSVQARFALLKLMNKLAAPILPHVNVNPVEIQRSSLSGHESVSLMVYRMKGLLFLETKMSLLDQLLQQGAVQPSRIRLTINRVQGLHARKKQRRGEGLNGEDTFFGQLFAGLSNVDYRMFRGQKNDCMFQVAFVGEGAVDAGGPYREAIMLACNDLMSDTVPLFTLCGNGTNDIGGNRTKYVVDPSATTDLQLSMFAFVGALFGLALRTKTNLPVDISSLMWKRILGDVPDRKDLEGVDHMCLHSLQQMLEMSEEDFDELMQLDWTTTLTGGVLVRLKDTDDSVRYAEREEYAERVIDARLSEGERQIQAIRSGLNAVVPLNHLALLTWTDLERLVCGDPDVDVETLQRHSVYEDGHDLNSPAIVNFWKVLESFSPKERQLFLRFTWGRSRLPLSDADWNQKLRIQLPPHATDETLPVANTCNFALALPAYSSFEICRKKLLFAMVNCEAIDTDYTPTPTSTGSAWLGMSDADDPDEDDEAEATARRDAAENATKNAVLLPSSGSSSGEDDERSEPATISLPTVGTSPTRRTAFDGGPRSLNSSASKMTRPTVVVGRKGSSALRHVPPRRLSSQLKKAAEAPAPSADDGAGSASDSTASEACSESSSCTAHNDTTDRTLGEPGTQLMSVAIAAAARAAEANEAALAAQISFEQKQSAVVALEAREAARAAQYWANQAGDPVSPDVARTANGNAHSPAVSTPSPAAKSASPATPTTPNTPTVINVDSPDSSPEGTPRTSPPESTVRGSPVTSPRGSAAASPRTSPPGSRALSPVASPPAAANVTLPSGNTVSSPVRSFDAAVREEDESVDASRAADVSVRTVEDDEVRSTGSACISPSDASSDDICEVTTVTDTGMDSTREVISVGGSDSDDEREQSVIDVDHVLDDVRPPPTPAVVDLVSDPVSPATPQIAAGANDAQESAFAAAARLAEASKAAAELEARIAAESELALQAALQEQQEREERERPPLPPLPHHDVEDVPPVPPVPVGSSPEEPVAVSSSGSASPSRASPASDSDSDSGDADGEATAASGPTAPTATSASPRSRSPCSEDVGPHVFSKARPGSGHDRERHSASDAGRSRSPGVEIPPPPSRQYSENSPRGSPGGPPSPQEPAPALPATPETRIAIPVRDPYDTDSDSGASDGARPTAAAVRHMISPNTAATVAAVAEAAASVGKRWEAEAQSTRNATTTTTTTTTRQMSPPVSASSTRATSPAATSTHTGVDQSGLASASNSGNAETSGNDATTDNKGTEPPSPKDRRAPHAASPAPALPPPPMTASMANSVGARRETISARRRAIEQRTTSSSSSSFPSQSSTRQSSVRQPRLRVASSTNTTRRLSGSLLPRRDDSGLPNGIDDSGKAIPIMVPSERYVPSSPVAIATDLLRQVSDPGTHIGLAGLARLEDGNDGDAEDGSTSSDSCVGDTSAATSAAATSAADTSNISPPRVRRPRRNSGDQSPKEGDGSPPTEAGEALRAALTAAKTGSGLAFMRDLMVETLPESELAAVSLGGYGSVSPNRSRSDSPHNANNTTLPTPFTTPQSSPQRPDWASTTLPIMSPEGMPRPGNMRMTNAEAAIARSRGGSQGSPRVPIAVNPLRPAVVPAPRGFDRVTAQRSSHSPGAYLRQAMHIARDAESDASWDSGSDNPTSTSPHGWSPAAQSPLGFPPPPRGPQRPGMMERSPFPGQEPWGERGRVAVVAQPPTFFYGQRAGAPRIMR